MNAIILCGGLSTRLKDITKNIPKVLLDIKGKTVLDWQLEKLKKIGISEVVLAAGHLSHVLRETVGESRNGTKVIYAVEPERLGTGGAIKFAWDFVREPEAPTVILNGDVLTTMNLDVILSNLKPDSDGIILGAKVDDASQYGTLDFNENNYLRAFREKLGLRQPGYINGGFYVFNPAAKKYFPAQAAFSVEYDVFPNMKNLYVHPSDEPWIDIGVPERLEWARLNWIE